MVLQDPAIEAIHTRVKESHYQEEISSKALDD
jgi:hypothetical protein